MCLHNDLVSFYGFYWCPVCEKVVQLHDPRLSFKDVNAIAIKHMVPAIRKWWKNTDTLYKLLLRPREP